MSAVSAAFFAWVQGAPFYVDIHAAAVDLLPKGDGKTWLDVGCGPGLVARLASQRGYDVVGIDHDPAMILRARRLARDEKQCRFEVGDLRYLAQAHRADVVSAASLLFALPDRHAGIRHLWRCVSSGGSLLIVETTRDMVPARARQAMGGVRSGRGLALTLWALTRRGRTLDPSVFGSLAPASQACTLLLNGLVQACVFTKETT
ncbi:MAG: class I SAM-dependent methyltransferase [Gammaproteobacteria bacterium]|nr:class I SAM-dependent methyltransferase [Gammaproteobacteria bacterium]